jgi:succinylarginine dihydrolase
MKVYELNLDGLVGPTHHYGGLAKGNLASTEHAYQTANPRAAALQGIQKMRFLYQRNIKQAILPPHERPNFMLLKQLGLEGSPNKQLKQAALHPHLLTACFSASSMWAANTATVTPSLDSLDKKVHFTPANLISQLHRHQEADFSSLLLRQIFSDADYFKHHNPLPRTDALSDEGAANHNRICQQHHTQGIHLFVYGRTAFNKTSTPSLFPARQTLEASEAIARLHRIPTDHVLFAKQNPKAIDQGVFHHDVIGVANEHLLLIHENAWEDQIKVLDKLESMIDFPLQCIQIPEEIFSIKDAVDSYVFNSQLITLANHQMLLLAPHECQNHARVRPWIEALIDDKSNPITEVKFMNLKQSMQNGGGPACLRLRVLLTEQELQAMHPGVLVTEEKLDELEDWISKNYRTSLKPEDLSDPEFVQEIYRTLDKFTNILELGSIYSFQK